MTGYNEEVLKPRSYYCVLNYCVYLLCICMCVYICVFYVHIICIPYTHTSFWVIHEHTGLLSFLCFRNIPTDVSGEPCGPGEQVQASHLHSAWPVGLSDPQFTPGLVLSHYS